MKKITGIASIFLLSLMPGFCACAQQKAAEVSLDEKIGQMLMVGFRGLQAPPESHIAQVIQKYQIGGVVLFDYDVPAKRPLRNIQSPEQLRNLTQQLQSYTEIPLFIAIDQEGGSVSRLKEKFGFPPTVSAQYLGSLHNLDSTRFYAKKTAEILQNMGINLNLAPVVDLNINPENPVIGALERSFSADPHVVTRQAEAFITMMHRYDILTTLKHFPGHGSSKNDSHLGVVDVTQTWSRQELLPYQNLITKGIVDIIMTAHIYNATLDSTFPATLSKSTITGLLRDSLNYKGVVISDDLQMGAIRKYYGLRETIKRSILAGVDILVFANNSVFDPDIVAKAHSIIKDLLSKNIISNKRINASYKRIMALKEKLSE